MRKVDELEGYSIYKYKPSVFKPFYIHLEPLTLMRRIRFFFVYFTGYVVYYLEKNGEMIGYCVVQSGKDKRYKFANKNDILTGPALIKEEYRGISLYPMLLEYILTQSDLNYKNAYSYKQKSNLASIKVSERLGYSFFSDAKVTRFLRRIKLSKKGVGDFIIYKYKNK